MDSAEGAPLNLRAFLDQGSQASFITENSVQLLGLQRRKVHIKVNGLARVTETSAEMNLKTPAQTIRTTNLKVDLMTSFSKALKTTKERDRLLKKFNENPGLLMKLTP
nr:uncharacterized protein LOC118878774 [Drosophila suzukii]